VDIPPLCLLPHRDREHADVPAEQRIVLTEDFGRRVQMSGDRFTSLVADAKDGKLDGIALS
jgi:hypothetical protein